MNIHVDDKHIRLEPFGLRAARLGLANVEQVEKALAVQKMLDKNGQHQLLGMIMIDLEILTTTQLLSVLRSYEDEREGNCRGEL